jgi:hypothetical protein
MKQMQYGDRSWYLGDAAADLVMEYAVAMAAGEKADAVRMNVLDRAYDPVTMDVLIGPATMMTATLVMLDEAEPDNADLMSELRRRLDDMVHEPA